tara:strand:+ start:1200 stop:1694 length:495 start_codon:yes stop_codon:yes gene_type:complete
MSFKGRIKMSKQDNYNTPLQGWIDILQYIDHDAPLWIPFYNDGTALERITSLGFNDVYHEDKDFFSYDLSGYYIIDNPPYSIKEKCIAKPFKNKDKFAYLLPLDTLERRYLEKFREGLQVVIPHKRYVYYGKKGCPFKSCWFCWNMSEELGTTDRLIFQSGLGP